jgi:hypothetical protein
MNAETLCRYSNRYALENYTLQQDAFTSPLNLYSVNFFLFAV